MTGGMLTNQNNIQFNEKLKKLEIDLVAETEVLQKELLKMVLKKINYKDL